MTLNIFIFVVVAVVGVLNGVLHSTLWLQLNIPLLHKAAKVAKGANDVEMPSSVSPKTLKKFIGSLFGTAALAGVLIFVENSELLLTTYALGVVFGFAPIALVVLWKWLSILGGVGLSLIMFVLILDLITGGKIIVVATISELVMDLPGDIQNVLSK